MLAFHARLDGRDWATATEIRILDWSDLVAEDLIRPLPVRLLRATVAILGLIGGGTLGRYRRAHWRYACFALLPLAMIMLAAAVATVAGILLGGWGGLALGLATFTLLLAVADWKGHLGHLCADWISRSTSPMAADRPIPPRSPASRTRSGRPRPSRRWMNSCWSATVSAWCC